MDDTSRPTGRPRARNTIGLLLALPTLAMAWGTVGHQVVAEETLTWLTPEAKAEVTRLLALEPRATLVSVSTWADETRTPSTASWHYVNLPREAGCHYDTVQSRAAGHCAVGAIDLQAAILASDVPDEDRLKVLKYLVHLMADVHQPLHAGFADDRGGNLFQIQAYGRGSNLHALWDSTLIEHWPGGRTALQVEVAAQAAQVAPDPLIVLAAEASCRIVSSEGFYPADHRVGADYAQRWQPTVVRALSQAARRLAQRLNAAIKDRR